MNVGLPGTGIGGAFYLLSALMMPFVEARRLLRGERNAARVRHVLIQWSLAAGVISAIWLTGTALGWVVRIAGGGAAGADGIGGGVPVPEVLRAAALLITAGTLAGVLTAVQVARWMVRLRERRTSFASGVAGTDPRAGRRRRVVRAATVGLMLSGTAADAAAQTPLIRSRDLARADSAFDAGDQNLARDAYGVVLRKDPENSRATFRLAMLAPAGSLQALRMYRRYTQLEPDDAWGWIALGDAAFEQGRHREAADAFATAVRLAPGERDAVAGHARARAAVAPTLEPTTTITRDSDGNTTTAIAFAGKVLVADGLRIGAGLQRKRVADEITSVDYDEARTFAEWQPRRALRFEAGMSGVRIDAGADGRTFGAASFRARWLTANGGPGFDLRAARSALAASPGLLANHVRLEQLRGTLELPVAGPMRVRGLAQAARITAATERNTRTAAGGAVVVRIPSLEVSGGYQHMAYDAPTQLGYFAPRAVQLVEAASYAEIYSANTTVVVDVGVGAQRVETHAAVVGGWRHAFRLWSQVSRTLHPRLSLNLELEAYESQIEAVGTAANWRYGSAGLGLSWSLPR